MSGHSSLNPQVGASPTDVWQQFFREALRKRGAGAVKPAASAPEDVVAATTADAAAMEAGVDAAARVEDASSVASDDAAATDAGLHPRLSLSPVEVVALALFGASVFCFVSLLLYDPGDYFDSDVLRSRAEVSFGVGKAIFRPFGLAVYSLLGFTLFWSGAIFFRQGVRGVVLKAFGTAVFTTALAGLLGLAFPGEDGAGTLVHGGVVGEFLARRMTGSFDTLGAAALLVLVSLISLIFATDWFFTSLAKEGGVALEEDDDDAEAADEEDEAFPVVEDETAEVGEPAPAPVEAEAEVEVEVEEASAPVAAPPPVTVIRPGVRSRRHPEPEPIVEASEPETAPPPADDESEAANILTRAVRASSSSRRADTTPEPVELEPVEAEKAAPAPDEESESLEPPARGAVARPRLRWRRRDEAEASATDEAFGAGLIDAETRARVPAPVVEEVSEPVPMRESARRRAEPEPEAAAVPEPEPVDLEAEAEEVEEPVALEPEPEAEEYEAPVAVALEEEPPAPAESPIAAPSRKAQLSLFDEVIDEISRAGRESRRSAPVRRPSSPIPPVPPSREHVPAPIDDATYGDAVRVVLEAGRGSVSLLQRRLDVGYVTANRLLEMMERDGVVGEHRGSGPREVRTTIDEWNRRKSSGGETAN